MPLFEFRCNSCNRKFTAFVGMIADSSPPKCPECGGENLSRLISRFSRGRSEDEMLESLADPVRLGDLEDPSNMHRFVKEMGKELGEDIEDEMEDYLQGSEEAEDEDVIY